MSGKQSRIDWEPWDAQLGTCRDGTLAARITAAGPITCTRDMVRCRRAKMRVSAHRGLDPEANCGKVDWERWEFYLGEMHDGQLRDKIKRESDVTVTTEAIVKARKARGIPAFDGRKKVSHIPSYTSAASKAGVTVEEYTALKDAGLKFCVRCRNWHSKHDFVPSGHFGRIDICRKAGWSK
jgi:hypothetical protein